MDSPYTHITVMADNVVRVSYTLEKKAPEKSILIAEDFTPRADILTSLYESQEDCVLFKNKHREVILKEMAHILTEKAIYKYVIDGEPVVKYRQTANGEVAYIENARQEPNGTAYEGKLVFEVSENEAI